MLGMTDTADPVMRTVDDRALSARGFFDADPALGDVFPPPQADWSAAAVPVTPFPAIPQLPRTAPPAPPAASPFEFSAAATLIPSPTPARPKPRGGGRRFVSWLLVIGIGGGGIYAGITYGPDLLDRAKGESTSNEPSAPLAFPVVVAPLTPARTATVVVERPSDDGTSRSYEVTNDFETGISRMVVDRATTADVEVLAVFDVANVRLADDPNWYSMPRGEFPFVGGSERQRWLRTIDEYLPPTIRSFVTIDAATESVVGTETMRHLVVTIDAAGIATSAAAPAIDPMTGLAIPPPPTTPGEFVLPTSITGSTEAIVPVTIEIWIDANGMVRKVVEPASMGGETVTVTSISADAFMPAFPEPEVVTPLGATQLLELAL